MQKDGFAVSVSVKLSLKKKKKRSTHKTLVVSDLFCLQSFVFKQLQYLHLQYSFWVCAGASRCILKKKKKKEKLVLWFMKLCFQETNISDNIPLKLDMQKLPAQARNLSFQNDTVISKSSDLCIPSASTFLKLSNAFWSFLGIILKIRL